MTIARALTACSGFLRNANKILTYYHCSTKRLWVVSWGRRVSLQPPVHLSNFCWWDQTSVLGGSNPPTPWQIKHCLSPPPCSDAYVGCICPLRLRYSNFQVLQCNGSVVLPPGV